MPEAQTVGHVLGKYIEEIPNADDGFFFRPCVLYEYWVDDNRYTSNRVTQWNIADGSPYFAKRKLKNYDYGMKVTVTYDIHDPQNAYLEKHGGGAFVLEPKGLGCLILYLLLCQFPMFAMMFSSELQAIVIPILDRVFNGR